MLHFTCTVLNIKLSAGAHRQSPVYLLYLLEELPILSRSLSSDFSQINTVNTECECQMI